MKNHAKMTKVLLVAGVLASGAVAVAIAGQPRGSSGGAFALEWDSMDSAGGGRSGGGQFAVVDAIGQHDAGPPMGGGAFALQDGFLALQPTPPLDADLLAIY